MHVSTQCKTRKYKRDCTRPKSASAASTPTNDEVVARKSVPASIFPRQPNGSKALPAYSACMCTQSLAQDRSARASHKNEEE